MILQLLKIGKMQNGLVMKSIVPVVMAGVLGIYGLIIAVVISTNIEPTSYTLYQGYAHLGSGLACGLSGVSAGMCIGIVGDAPPFAPLLRPVLPNGVQHGLHGMHRPENHTSDQELG